MIKVGCCGFPVAAEKYQSIFRLVEVNSTFYRYLKPSTAQKWRKTAPQSFEFTVKAHRDVTHKHKLKAVQSCLDAFNRVRQTCENLNARVLLLQTPASFGPDRLRDAMRFFKTIDRGDVALVWETRGERWNQSKTRMRLSQVLREAMVSHVTDPLQAAPAFTTEIAYFRLHGAGERMYYYQYSDNELRSLQRSLQPFLEAGKDVYVLFNNLSMFEDAQRFQHFLAKGEFPSLTGKTGLECLREILGRTRYPATKDTLMSRVGWRLIEVAKGKQVKLQTLLAGLTAKKYENAQQLISELEKKLQHNQT